MENDDYETHFNNEMSEVINTLRNGNEAERLLAIAKIEEKCYSRHISDFVVDSMISTIKNDDSATVRSYAMRAMYHQSSEMWPYQSHHRKILLDAIRGGSYNDPSHQKMYGFDHWIADTILECDQQLKWLRR